MVVLDIVVTDNHDEPVQNLPKQDFLVAENGKAQTISSFEEHKGRATRAASNATPAARCFHKLPDKSASANDQCPVTRCA